MTWNDTVKFAEDHPMATAGIVFVGGLAVLWLLGYLSPAQAAPQDNSLAAAYYQSEAAQTLAGVQLQTAQVAAQRDTAIADISAKAATAIQGAWATAQTTQAQYASTVDITSAELAADVANKQHSLDTIAAITGNITPIALANGPGMEHDINLSLPTGQFSVNTGYGTGLPVPNTLKAGGFSQDQINKLFGFG